MMRIEFRDALMLISSGFSVLLIKIVSAALKISEIDGTIRN
jgi:hypothetical protein